MAKEGEELEVEMGATDTSERIPFQLQFDKPFPFPIKIAEWNPEKDLLAIVTEDSKVLLHRFNWQRLGTICPGKCITSLCWRSDGKAIAFGLEDGSILLHDVENGKLLRSIKSHNVVVVCLNWEEDALLIMGDSNHTYEDRTMQLSKYKSFSNTKTQQGQESNKDRVCIDILERERRRNPMAGEDSATSPLLADDLHMKLLYLENRVAFARLLFPTEAKVAMEIAQAETTSEFIGLLASRCLGNLRRVDLNETPTMLNEWLRSRVDALMKIVELGRRYFPHCSQVLDKILEEDLPDLFYLQKGTPDEQKIKRMCFNELKEDVQKAFNRDKAYMYCSCSA